MQGTATTNWAGRVHALGKPGGSGAGGSVWLASGSMVLGDLGGAGSISVNGGGNGGAGRIRLDFLSSDVNGVNQLGMSGTSTEHYHEAGEFYLEVNSECSWSIKVTPPAIRFTSAPHSVEFGSRLTQRRLIPPLSNGRHSSTTSPRWRSAP